MACATADLDSVSKDREWSAGTQRSDVDILEPGHEEPAHPGQGLPYT